MTLTSLSGSVVIMAGAVAGLLLLAGVALFTRRPYARWIGVLAGAAGVAGSALQVIEAQDGGPLQDLETAVMVGEALFFAVLAFGNWRVGSALRNQRA